MTTFALVTPIGMIIGTVISEYKTEDIAYVISIATLQGEENTTRVRRKLADMSRTGYTCS